MIPAALFDADQCAKELLDHDEDVRQLVCSAFGNDVYLTDGSPDRVRLREIVFGDPSKRHELEQILHPAIRSKWLALAEESRAARRWLAVDIPLLYETGAESLFDAVIVVACRPSTQMQRLLNIRKLPRTTAEKMIAAQIDLNHKISKADHVIWNDGSDAGLENQTRLLVNLLKKRHG